jgi:hypothetical protein
MSIKIVVFPTAKLLAAIESNPDNVMVIEKKKEEKVFQGTRYNDIFFNLDTSGKKKGWFL